MHFVNIPHYIPPKPTGAVILSIRFYRKLALKQQQVWFASVDASAHPELARDLGLKAVPSFITFREGNVVTASSTSDKRKIEKLLEELMYD